LDDQQQQVLNALVALDGASTDLLIEVSGLPDLPSLDSIPLDQRRGDEYRAHNLWHELLTENETHKEMQLVGGPIHTRPWAIR